MHKFAGHHHLSFWISSFWILIFINRQEMLNFILIVCSCFFSSIDVHSMNLNYDLGNLVSLFRGKTLFSDIIMTEIITITIIVDQIIIRNAHMMIVIGIGIINQLIDMVIEADRTIGIILTSDLAQQHFTLSWNFIHDYFVFVDCFSRTDDRYNQNSNRYDPDPAFYYARTDPNSPYYRGNGYDNRDPEYYYKVKGSSSTGYSGDGKWCEMDTDLRGTISNIEHEYFRPCCDAWAWQQWIQQHWHDIRWKPLLWQPKWQPLR